MNDHNKIVCYKNTHFFRASKLILDILAKHKGEKDEFITSALEGYSAHLNINVPLNKEGFVKIDQLLEVLSNHGNTTKSEILRTSITYMDSRDHE